MGGCADPAVDVPPGDATGNEEADADETRAWRTSEPEEGARECGGAGALSTCLTPQKSAAYYVDQANKYFDTLDGTADPKSVPAYSDAVARWEWPPWIYLTGYGKNHITLIDWIIKAMIPSTTVPTRDCRAFATQPFTRCHVVIKYDKGLCPIYEEFTHNDQGEMTFVEAWSMVPNLPPSDAAPVTAMDPWAERPDAHRLSSKIPGLGSKTGRFDLNAAWMQDAAKEDPEVALFVRQTKAFYPSVLWNLYKSGGIDAAFARECGWAQ